MNRSTLLRPGAALLVGAALVAVPVMGATNASATETPTTGNFTWNTGDNGSDKAAPQCEPGQGTSLTYILSGNGAKIIDAGTGSLNGGPAVDGEIKGEAGGSAHYTVTGDYNTVATKFTATAVKWTGATAPFLKLSHSSCTGTPTPPPPVKTKVTAVDGTFDDTCGLVFNASFKEKPTEGVNYVVTRDGNTLTVKPKVTDAAKYVLTNPEWTQSYTDKLVACPVPPGEPSASSDVGQCTDNNQRPVTVTAVDVPKGANLVRVKDGAEVVAFKSVDTSSGPATVTFDLGNLPAGTYNYSLDYSGVRIEGFKTIALEPIVVPECKVTTPVSPTSPTAVDKCEPAVGTDDSLTIPEDSNFTYTLDGVKVEAGTDAPTKATHVVKAVANPGVVVKEGAQTEWTFTFTKLLCVVPSFPVSPTEPTKIDKCEPTKGTNDAVVIPADSHFTYTINGKVVTGTVPATTTSATVKATPAEGVVVTEGAKTEWTFTFTKVNCPVEKPPVKDNCPKMDGVQGPNDKCVTPSSWHPPTEDDGDVNYQIWVYAALVALLMVAFAGGRTAIVAARRS